MGERVRFENWVVELGCPVVSIKGLRYSDGTYYNFEAQLAWEAWQARAEQDQIRGWDWRRLDQELPPERDRWYLFGGWTDNGDWVFEKMHYSLNGTIEGWSVEATLRNGRTHWCEVIPPNEHEENADFDFERDSNPNGDTLCGKLGRPHRMKRIHHSKTICIYGGCDARI